MAKHRESMTDATSRRAQMHIAVPTLISDGGVIAIGRGLDAGAVVDIGDALRSAGIGAFEVALGSRGALEAIDRLRARSPDDLLIGAGTVLSVDDAAAALSAGASFLVMPVTDRAVIGWAAARGVPTFPGAMTPTEALAAWSSGAAAIKVFPSSVTGTAFIRELHGPFPEIPVVPTGGIARDSAARFIAAGAIAVGVGGWLIGDGNRRGIARRGRQLVRAIHDERGRGATT